MNALADIQKLIDPATLDLPDSPRISRIEIQDGFDWAGEPALYIMVLLEDDTSPEDRTWLKVKPIDRAITNAVFESGDERYPHVRIRTESEHRELTAE